ncbi:hypothetical protein TUM13066_30980 [Escherichia coli]|uniref:Citrate synthase n=7 Tax=Enterobacteriaceae TaxID=543 RepID=A0ABC8E154_ECOLX|nr:Hypothetical protein c0797 [Escherichia coli CFT073]ABE06209.1 hypothetical protein UTI89_C0716 [Escherichia coli UTI89]ABG68758.1 hypothetical protein ECP_0732 [Escherichia coli 536]ADN45346.1 hypothetical protein ECABU_c07640 [Escherichia coli ABU 83972]AER83356.1 hypothetical protein i02_0768 [Escherichia coli str. 'clone D i2']AER88275.1 hypothetical protein i14_0768 [Escherichia coli str. 'clone D i14']AHG07425.1 hypothetical protein ECRM13514_0732 [Escherichia coli O145:H28 str. RM13
MLLYQPFKVSLAPYCVRLPELKFAFAHQPGFTRLLFGSPLCERGENLGTELWALAGKGSIDDE